MIAPSAWVEAYLDCLPVSGRVLDLACGQGRHVRLLANGKREVHAVDRDPEALSRLAGLPGVQTRRLDLETESWPLAGERFDGIVVTNYLWRPQLDALMALLAPAGVLIYETFMIGNAAFGKPSRPEFLLQPGELRERCAAAGLCEKAFFEGYAEQPKPCMRQAIVAERAI